MRRSRDGWKVVRVVKEETLARIRRDRRGAPEGVAKVLEVIERRIFDSSFDVPTVRDFSTSTPDALFHFSRHLGLDVRTYVRQRRLGAACRLLGESGAHVSEIGVSLGFPDLDTFRKWFRKHTGLSPKRFRDVGPPIERSPRPDRPAASDPVDAGTDVDVVTPPTPSLGRRALLGALTPQEIDAFLRFLRVTYPEDGRC